MTDKEQARKAAALEACKRKLKADQKKKQSTRRQAGRPPMFETPQELQKLIDGYFRSLPEDDAAPTITGLVLHCGFCSRQSFYDYEKRPGFAYTIKRARLMIENEYEKALYLKGGAGPIFALKNFGWTDKKDLDIQGDLNISKIESFAPSLGDSDGDADAVSDMLCGIESDDDEQAPAAGDGVEQEAPESPESCADNVGGSDYAEDTEGF